MQIFFGFFAYNFNEKFDTKIFCNRLKELRKDANISSVALAKILEVSDTTILRWEKGKMLPTIDKLYYLSKYFKVSTDYLLGLED